MSFGQSSLEFVVKGIHRQLKENVTWQKGQSGNPSGRPKGARNLLSETVLINHWEDNGLDAIDRTCKKQPAAYLRAVLSPVPKDFAMTVERDETPQHIEVRFVDNLEVSGRLWR